jgi:hypothetical protein
MKHCRWLLSHLNPFTTRKVEMPKYRDLTNKQFGRLTAMWPSGRTQYGKRHTEVVWLCSCTCGNYKNISADRLIRKRKPNISCGCTVGEPRFIHHGQTRHESMTPTYVSYHTAKQRCRDPKHENYPYYGGRGIEFRFDCYEAFHAELGDRPKGMTIDRMDVNGHYERGNVRWATAVEQRRNRRKRTA